MTDLELRARRVRLRPLVPADRERIGTILTEPEVARWWVHDAHATTLAGLFREDEDDVRLAIEVDGTLIGMIQFGEETESDYRHASIDLFVETAWQGQGIGPEAIRLLARYLFEARGHHRITIDPAATNEPAIRAYERVGFRRVGVMRNYERGADGQWHDGLLMELLREDLIE